MGCPEPSALWREIARLKRRVRSLEARLDRREKQELAALRRKIAREVLRKIVGRKP